MAAVGLLLGRAAKDWVVLISLPDAASVSFPHSLSLFSHHLSKPFHPDVFNKFKMNSNIHTLAATLLFSYSWIFKGYLKLT